MLLKARQATGVKTRTELYKNVEVILKHEAPDFTIAHPVVFEAVRANVVGYKVSPLVTRRSEVASVRCHLFNASAGRLPRAGRRSDVVDEAPVQAIEQVAFGTCKPYFPANDAMASGLGSPCAELYAVDNRYWMATALE